MASRSAESDAVFGSSSGPSRVLRAGSVEPGRRARRTAASDRRYALSRRARAMASAAVSTPSLASRRASRSRTAWRLRNSSQAMSVSSWIAVAAHRTSLSRALSPSRRSASGLSAARRKFLLDRGRVHNRGGESRCDGVGGRDHAQRRGARRARAPGGEADASLSGCAAREGRALRGRWPVERGDRHPAWDVLEGRRAVAATILRTAPGRS